MIRQPQQKTAQARPSRRSQRPARPQVSPHSPQPPKKRCIILIDGSNFYFKLKDLKLHRSLSIDFGAFMQYLAAGDQLIESTYYIGKVMTDGTENTAKMHADQQKLFLRLKEHGVRYSLGYLLKNDGIMHEKGVDVQIATDMLIAAYENRADRILLLSSDTDLLPAIKRARAKGKIVHYVGFDHMPSRALIRETDSATLLTADNMRQFLPTQAAAQPQTTQKKPTSFRQPTRAKRSRSFRHPRKK